MTAEFRDAIRSAGLEPPDLIEPGKFLRFPGVGKGRGNDSGWCKLFPDCVGGIFGDFSQGFEATWQAKRERQYTKEEVAVFKKQIAEANAKAEEERRLKQLHAANSATMIWLAAKPATDHPYLTRKGVGANGLRIHNGALVIPVREGKTLHSLQFIMADGEKLFLSGGRVTGCYFGISNKQYSDVLCIAEGFATAASIHEATGYPVAVAFNAGNLDPVAKAMRAKFPKLKLLVCADDDAETEGNPGVTQARVAARNVGAMLAIPDFGAERPAKVTDFNDLAQWHGSSEVQNQIETAIRRCEEIPLEQLIAQANQHQ